MKIFYILFFVSICTLFTGCYTIEQGYNQIKLLMSEESLAQAVQENKDNPDRMQKLNLIGPVLEYAEKQVDLTPKNSYKKFVELKSPYVVWVVQAADKRSLNLKTWWFPLVGEQPYLGFFNKEDALNERKKLLSENYDVAMGGVKAFSLLGYFDDPIYSSMLDGVSVTSFIETLIHETVHRTMYVKNNYAFNENLANFIARKATADFLKLHPEIEVSSAGYISQYENNQKIQLKFNQFLMQTKTDLQQFYAAAHENSNLKNDDEFLKVRQNKFDAISDNYLLFMQGGEKNSDYEFAFSKGKFNNAVILSYSVYEEDQKPLENLFIKSNSNLKQMVDRLKSCLDNNSESHEKILNILSYCFK